MKITNENDIPLGLAVWLLYDDYDLLSLRNYISVTQLMKPTRAIVLSRRLPWEDRTMDLVDLIPSALGRSTHAGVEKAWTEGYKPALKALGYPDKVIKNIRINPTPEEIQDPNLIPIYLEQRATKEITVNGTTYIVGGKFDQIISGILHDVKTTSAWSWVYGGRDEDYILQGSMYRWLNPQIVEEDILRINFIFTDWQKSLSKTSKGYPASRIQSKDYQLLSLQETEDWITRKIKHIQQEQDKDQFTLVRCTDSELWKSDAKYKYYRDPTTVKTGGKSTKNFDTKAAADQYLLEKSIGVVITVPGEVKRCAYCDAYDICRQKDEYI